MLVLPVSKRMMAFGETRAADASDSKLTPWRCRSSRRRAATRAVIGLIACLAEAQTPPNAPLLRVADPDNRRKRS
jgi:hypothetical protein